MSKIVLRPYQAAAVAKILWAQKFEGNDLCVLPTGAGKSIVIAHLSKELKEPILILQPGKEILEQNMSKLEQYVDPSSISVFSASMNQKEINYFTFATIGSIYKKPELFKHFNLVIVDECHSVNPKNLSGMYTTFFKAIGNPKVIGFTATPYRMDIAYVREGYDLRAYTTIKLINRMPPKYWFWNRLIYNIDNPDLLAQGFLCPLKYIDASIIEHEDIPTNVSRSDFNLYSFEQKIKPRQQRLIEAVEWAEKTSKSVLVFNSSVAQAEKMQTLIEGSEVVSAKTPKKERERIIEGFKNHTIKTVFNVGVLTTGFDHPSLDCIILIRPTKSIGLYYQMLGRGVRLAPGKTHCKVIDMTSTVKNIGRIETIRLIKENGQWELISEKGHWHNQELYSYVVKTFATLKKNKDGLTVIKT